MNKHLIGLCGLLALSVVGLAAVHCSVSSAQESVTLTEHPLIGDLTAAEGLTICTRSDCDGHLLWDTSFSPGTPPETDFTYQSKRETAPYEDYGLDISTPFPGPHGYVSYNLFGDLEIIRRAQPELLPIAEALLGQTSSGESGAQILSLSDYTSTYPLHFRLELPDQLSRDSRNEEDSMFWSRLEETFRFPVDPAHRISAALTVRKGGEPEALALSPVPGKGVALHCHSLLSDTGVWFIPELRKEDGTLLDYSKTPGYGVYHLALPDKQLDIQNLRLVCSLPADAAVERLSATPDGSTLLVTTGGTSDKILHVLPLHHPEAQTSVCLSPDPAAEPWRIHAENGFLVGISSQGELVFLPKANNGGFHERFRAQLPQEAPHFCPDFRTGTFSATFDGTRLAVVLRSRNGMPNSFTLLTLQEESPGTGALTYAGQFVSSLDAAGSGVPILDQLLEFQKEEES